MDDEDESGDFIHLVRGPPGRKEIIKGEKAKAIKNTDVLINILIQENELNVFYTNANCFTNKIDELRERISSPNEPLHIIAITEAKSKNNRYGVT